MNRIKESFKKNKYIWLIVAVMIFVGIFLRTYKFHDLLRFNSDQGRDSELVSGVIEGTQPWPLLGPKAGGTTFKLGPMFYYFEIASAKIFGNYPDKMAYPDLITSILAIPLLYLFLRKYFNSGIAFAMASIFSLSEFAIRWSRFAWNPNSTPFWILVFLYSFHEIIADRNNRKFLWAITAGLAAGIGVQLHSMLLFILPLTLLIIFFYLLIKKNRTWKYFFVIFFLALILNIPQFYSEYSSGGANAKAFYEGVNIKQSGQESFFQNILHGNSAIAQIVPDILTGYEISDDFSVNFDKKHAGDVADVVLGTLFTLGGLILAVRYFRREKDSDKKVFLAIIGVYSTVAYLIFLKLAFETSVRMYLVIFFVPFMLLGFYLQFVKEKMHNHYLQAMLLASVFFISINIFFVKAYFAEFEAYASGNGSVNISTLGEMEKFSQFIASNANKENKLYISGDKKFFFINYSPIRYLVERSGKNLVLVGSKEIESLSMSRFFYIARENKLDNLNNDQNYKISQQKTYGKFTILLLEKR